MFRGAIISRGTVAAIWERMITEINLLDCFHFCEKSFVQQCAGSHGIFWSIL
jgi:hypothetical protein